MHTWGLKLNKFKCICRHAAFCGKRKAPPLLFFFLPSANLGTTEPPSGRAKRPKHGPKQKMPSTHSLGKAQKTGKPTKKTGGHRAWKRGSVRFQIPARAGPRARTMIQPHFSNNDVIMNEKLWKIMVRGLSECRQKVASNIGGNKEA
jgi:hypothetical protein